MRYFIFSIFLFATFINANDGKKTWLPPRDAYATIVRGHDHKDSLVYESATEGIWEIGNGEIWHKPLGQVARDVTAEYTEVPPGFIVEKMRRIRASQDLSSSPGSGGSIRPINPTTMEGGSIRPVYQGTIRKMPANSVNSSGSIRTTTTTGSIRTMKATTKKIWNEPSDGQAKIVRGFDNVETIVIESSTEGIWEIGHGEIWHQPIGRSARDVTAQFEPIHMAYIEDRMARLKKAGSIRITDTSASIRVYYDRARNEGSGSTGSIRPISDQKASTRVENQQTIASAHDMRSGSIRPQEIKSDSIRTMASTSESASGSIRTKTTNTPSSSVSSPVTGSIRTNQLNQESREQTLPPQHRRTRTIDINRGRSDLHLKAGKTIRPGDDIAGGSIRQSINSSAATSSYDALIGGGSIRQNVGGNKNDDEILGAVCDIPACKSANAHLSRSIRPSAAVESSGSDLLRISESQLTWLQEGYDDTEGYGPDHHESPSVEATDVHRSIRDDPKYIKRKPVHNYLRVFFDYFHSPLRADSDSVDQYIDKMTRCEYSNNRRSFRADIGGGLQVGKFSLGQLTGDNELLNYVSKQFNQLEEQKKMPDKVKAMLAVWTLFSMTSEILTAMNQHNPWAYCDCSKCDKENEKIMQKITIHNGQQFELKTVADNAQLVAEMVQDKIGNYDPKDDWIHEFMLRNRGNSIRDKIGNMVRSLSIRARRIPSLGNSIRRSMSGRYGRGMLC